VFRKAIFPVVLLLCLVPFASFAQSGAAGRRPSTYTIRISSNVQGADVAVDGKGVGVTPLSVSLAAGEHTVSVSARGYVPYSGKLAVSRDDTLNVTLRPAAYKVTIASNVQGADVAIDGKGVGTTPVGVSLGAGEHSISVSARGYTPYVGKFTVTKDDTLTFALSAMAYKVTIASNVQGADVAIDGKGVGTTPVGVSLGAGEHSVSVSARGYTPYVGRFTVSRDDTLTFALSPLTVRVSMASNAPGADVVLSGPGPEVRGQVPFNAQLLPGSYNVNVTAPGYNPYVGRIVVNMDANQSFTFNLEASTVKVEIVTNVPASVRIMGGTADVSVQARTPVTLDLIPDQYNVVLEAPGYDQAIRGIVVDPKGVDPKTKVQRYSFVLQASMATLDLVFSRQFLDPDLKEEREARKLVKLYLDGKLLNPKGELVESVPVEPGKHRIRVTSGGFSFQADEYDFQPGVHYTVELMLQLLIKTDLSSGR